MVDENQAVQETREVGAGDASGDLVAAAQAAAAAMSAAGACADVCVTGTAANTDVYAFKVAWNTLGWGADPAPAGSTGANASDPNQFAYGPLAHNGQYDVACMAAMNAAGAGAIAPAACATPCGGGTPLVPTCPAGQHWDASAGQCVPDAITPPSKGLPKWAMWLIAILIAGGVAALGLYLYKRFGSSNPSGAGESRRRPRKRGKRKGKRKAR